MALRRAALLTVTALLLVLLPALLAPGAASAAGRDGNGDKVKKEQIPEYGVDPGDKNALGSRRTWAVQPSGPNGPGIRPAFRYALAPGTSVVDWVGVSNFSRKPVRLQLYATDAFTSPDGGFGLLTGEQAPADVGSWVRFRQRAVTVPARSRLDVPFDLEIPPDATPGDHSGGVVAALRSEQRSKGGALVAVDQRIASRLYLRVDGPLKPVLTVTSLRASFHQSRNPVSGAATVAWTVRNDGNVRLAGPQRLRITTPFGGTTVVKVPLLRELLPGSSASFRTQVDGVRPAVRLKAEVVERGRLVDPDLGDVGAVVAEASRSVAFWAPPLALLVLLGLLLAGLAASLLVRRHRRRPEDRGSSATATLPVLDDPLVDTNLPENTRAHTPA